ncbi:hypothetical protein KIPB_011089, partial [Kipferlia bialata]
KPASTLLLQLLLSRVVQAYTANPKEYTLTVSDLVHLCRWDLRHCVLGHPSVAGCVELCVTSPLVTSALREMFSQTGYGKYGQAVDFSRLYPGHVSAYGQKGPIDNSLTITCRKSQSEQSYEQLCLYLAKRCRRYEGKVHSGVYLPVAGLLCECVDASMAKRSKVTLETGTAGGARVVCVPVDGDLWLDKRALTLAQALANGIRSEGTVSSPPPSVLPAECLSLSTLLKGMALTDTEGGKERETTPHQSGYKSNPVETLDGDWTPKPCIVRGAPLYSTLTTAMRQCLRPPASALPEGAASTVASGSHALVAQIEQRLMGAEGEDIPVLVDILDWNDDTLEETEDLLQTLQQCTSESAALSESIARDLAETEAVWKEEEEKKRETPPKAKAASAPVPLSLPLPVSQAVPDAPHTVNAPLPTVETPSHAASVVQSAQTGHVVNTAVAGTLQGVMQSMASLSRDRDRLEGCISTMGSVSAICAQMLSQAKDSVPMPRPLLALPPQYVPTVQTRPGSVLGFDPVSPSVPSIAVPIVPRGAPMPNPNPMPLPTQQSRPRTPPECPSPGPSQLPLPLPLPLPASLTLPQQGVPQQPVGVTYDNTTNQYLVDPSRISSKE